MRKIKYFFQKRHSGSLNIDQWGEILEEAKRFGFNGFYLRILDEIENQKLREFLNFLSAKNFLIELEDRGFWDKKKKETFIESDVYLFWLTFYGLKAKTHDDFEGGGDFQRNLEKIDYLAKQNLSIGLRYILTEKNFDEVFEFLKFLSDLKYQFKEVVIEEVSPLEGIYFKKELLISPDKLKLYLSLIKKYSAILSRLRPVKIRIFSNYQNHEHYPFISGEEIIVESNGDVRSWPLFSKKIGNVFFDSFSKIHSDLVEDLNESTLEGARKNRFLNWAFVIPGHPQLKGLQFQDINRVILPNNFNILMTKKCNFRCDFCEFDCKPGDTEAIDIKDFEKLLKEGRQLGVRHITFDGGEPLVYPDIKTALELANDLKYETTVLTNGWYFENFIEDYKKNRINHFAFGLFGASAKVHDTITGKEGAFDRCVSAMKTAKSLGYSISLNTVLHPLNFSELDKLLDLAEQLGVNHFMQIFTINPVGRAKNNPSLILSEKQKTQIPKIYQRHRNFISKLISFNGYQSHTERHLECKYLSRFGPLAVFWDGTVGLCALTSLLKLPFLKIKEHSLIDCLIFMNKINEIFQVERNQEFLNWHPEIKEVSGCVYCQEKLLKDFSKYLSFLNKENFLT